MRKFSDASLCPKCGFLGSTVVYHRPGTPTCKLDDEADRAVEHLHRLCERCSYQWGEEPLG